MSIKKIKKASIDHLNTLSPVLPTSYEGVDFTPPTTIYQIVQFVIQPPDDPVLGTGYYRERLQLQVFISSPGGKGEGESLTRAELVRDKFKKGTTLSIDNILIHVLDTPQIAGNNLVDQRILVPVLINLVAEIYTG